MTEGIKGSCHGARTPRGTLSACRVLSGWPRRASIIGVSRTHQIRKAASGYVVLVACDSVFQPKAPQRGHQGVCSMPSILCAPQSLL